MRRRDFLAQSVTGWLAHRALFAAAPPILAGVPPVPRNVGLQLYTVRNEMQRGFDETLGRVASIGYREVEFAGYFGRTPQQVRDVLRKNQLEAPSAHVTLAVLKRNWPQTVEVAAEIGHRYLVLAYLFPPERSKLDDYKTVAELLNRCGEVCAQSGIQMAYHNHDFEFESLAGAIPFDVLLGETDSRLVKIELDLYWAVKAGQIPERLFAAHKNRFALVHVKDMDSTPKRFFTEVGRGVIDFGKLLPAARKAGVKHFFVEQDECPGSPFDSIGVSFEYLRKLKF